MERPSNHDLGHRFERMAEAWLCERGWHVIGRNVRRDRKEVDLIVRRGGVTAFVEVKGRRSVTSGHPLEAVTWRKRREIEHVARRWAQEQRTGLGALRFDVIAIVSGPGSTCTIEHVAHAWHFGQ